MYVITWGDRVDPAEARVRQPTGEYDVPVEPALTRRDLGERHPYLKGDARLLREDGDRTTSGDGAAYRLEQRTDGGVFPSKVVVQIVASAGMRLIAVSEPAPTMRAGPERGTIPWSHMCS